MNIESRAEQAPSVPVPTEGGSAKFGTVLRLRTYLLGLIVALVAPAFAFAGLLLWSFHNAGVKQYEGDALDLARRLTAVIEREVVAVERSLQVLATSRLFTEKRFEDLHKQAIEIKNILGSDIVIKDATGQQLVNTRLPWGTPLPISLPEADREALEKRMPTVSDLFVGATAKRPILSVNVPIVQDDKVTGLINTGIDPHRLSKILREQGVAETWTAAVVDRRGKIVARSRQAERYVGTTATEDLRKSAVGSEGTWVGWTADRIPVFAAYSRSDVTGWVTAVGIPKSIIEGPLRRSVMWLAIGSILALLVSVAVAQLLSRPLVRWTEALVASAAALRRGAPFYAPAARVVELNSLSHALSQASAELRSLHSGLESQVAERTSELIQTHKKLVAEVKRRETIEERLRHSQKMEAIGQLTGGLAHDFNNLLTIIGGSLQMMQRRMDRGDTGALQRYVHNATEGVEKASALTSRLLAFGRQQPLTPRVIDTNALVNGMSDLLQRSLGESIKIETVLAGGLWRTRADANQLENAILNVALNARDAMPGGGKLSIETANVELDARYSADNPGVSSGQFVMISVTDTGIGMSPETLNRAFDPFFTTKSPGQGTGLGLSQVYGFAGQSGGHVKIYSEEGNGTSVKLYLPRFYGEAGQVSEYSSDRVGVNSTHKFKTILVVEDNESVRKLSVEFLAELGYRTIEASSALAALPILDSSEDIDLLFTDVVMPDMNGRLLADEARRRRPTLKVLFTTGYTKNAIVDQGVVDQDVLLVTKPFTIQELAGKLDQVFKNSDKSQA